MPDSKHGLVEAILDRVKGQPPSPPRPQPPGLPKPPATSTPGTPQHELTKAQDDARNNPAFRPQKEKTFCNRATCAIVKRMNGPMGALTYPSGEYAVANDTARYLAEDALSPAGHWRAVDTPSEAQQLANKGIVVVGVQRGSLGQRGMRGHGHMVTVRPETMPGFAENHQKNLDASSSPRQILPIVNSIGREIMVAPAATAFPDTREPLHYYTPRER